MRRWSMLLAGVAGVVACGLWLRGGLGGRDGGTAGAAPVPALRMAGEAERAGTERLGVAVAHGRGTARGWPKVVRFGGPVRTEAAGELRAAGAAVAGYLPDCALLAEIPESAMEAVRAVPGVAGVEEYRPAWKVSAGLLAAAKKGAGERVAVRVQTFAAEDEGPIAARMARLGAADVAVSGRGDGRERSRWGLVSGRMAAGAVLELAAEPEVRWMEEAREERLCNDVARSAGGLAAEALRTLGLDGAGQVVAVMDTGLDSGDAAALHRDFEGRVELALAYAREGDWSDPEGHGTHVAGSLAGSGAASEGRYRGMAPAARLVVQSVADARGALMIPADLNGPLEEAYAAGVRIHNDSWGSDSAGEYTIRAQQADEFTWNHPDLLAVVAAGNEGRDADGDGVTDAGSLASPASAKNVLTVGAAESGRAPDTGGRTGERYGKRWASRFGAEPIASDFISSPPEGGTQGLAAFSSRGPAADGRTKPDVVATGTDVVSVLSTAPGAGTGWGPLEGSADYCFSGGTSMATPLAAGAAVLVRQWAQRRFGLASPSAAALKAALCGGARSLSPGQYGDGEFREIPPRPSGAEGHGHVDLEATLRPGGGAVAVLHEGTGEEALATGGEARYAFEIAEPGVPLTVVLAYSDAPGLPGAEVALVNDLDLRLAAPDGTVYGPGGEPDAEPDRLDNVERIDLASAATGRWEVVVGGWNVPEGPQPWAVYLRGAIRTAPGISHEPLQNQSAAAAGYGVEAEIRAEGSWNAATAVLHWRVDGGAERTAAMCAAGAADGSGGLFPETEFRAEIPAGGLGSRIEYWLTAGGSRAPEGDGGWVFTVAPDVALTVEGDPGEAGAPEPPYGTWMVPSGTVVRASAPAVIPDADEPETRRMACLGWRGSGSVPPEGEGAEVEIAVEEDSSIAWLWQEQVTLRETCDPALAEERSAWWAVGSGAESSGPAAEIRVDGSGARFAFAEWNLDGARWPDGVSPCPREARGIAMDGPRTLCARYLPEKLDSDGDGVPDWFAARYFPAGGAGPGADPDGDGWENEMEAADHSDPLDPSSRPAPPVIVHEPVASPHAGAFPVRISATVTDACGVASATLYIRRNGQAERAVAMSPDAGADGVWSAFTPGVAEDGDAFAYSIAAADAAGLVARTEEYGFEVRWPGLEASPLAGVRAELGADAVAVAEFAFANTGSLPLEISLSFAPVGFADDMESGTNGWSVSGAGASNAPWHIGGVEFHSASNAWSDALPDYLPIYACGADDSLVSPPVRLWPADAPGGDAPRLAFWHKADFERDWEGEEEAGDGVVRMWDAGLVEGRPEGGAWQPVVPDGGYPAVQAETASVFPGGTPCFAPTDGWEPVAAALSVLAPDAASASVPAQIRFRFASDAYVVHEGWRIDDVEITPRTHRAGDGANWASLSAGTLVLEPGGRTNVVLRLDNAGFGPMETDWQLLDIRHNDPRLPDPLPVPVALANIARRLSVTAEGPGTAEPAGETVHPGPATVRLGFVPDGGAMLADVQLDGKLLDGSLCGATNRVETDLPLVGNHVVHAVFAECPSAGSVPSAEWLARYGLTNRPAAAEAVLDPDRDGLLTWQEAELGSDPTDRADAPLRVRLLPPDAEGAWRLAWHAYTNPGAAYVLLSSTNLLLPFAPLFDTPLPAAPPVMTSPPLPPSAAHAAFHAVVFRP